MELVKVFLKILFLALFFHPSLASHILHTISMLCIVSMRCIVNALYRKCVVWYRYETVWKADVLDVAITGSTAFALPPTAYSERAAAVLRSVAVLFVRCVQRPAALLSPLRPPPFAAPQRLRGSKKKSTLMPTKSIVCTPPSKLIDT